MQYSCSSNKNLSVKFQEKIEIWRPNLFWSEHWNKFLKALLYFQLDPYILCSNSGQRLPIKLYLRNTELPRSLFIFRYSTLKRTGATYLHPFWTHTFTHKYVIAPGNVRGRPNICVRTCASTRVNFQFENLGLRPYFGCRRPFWKNR